MRAFFALPVVMFLLIAGFFAWPLISGRDPSVVQSALIDKPAPDMVLPPLMDGLPGLNTAALRDEVTLVNVFASWCPPCQVEHPVLKRLAAEGAFRLVGINYKDKPEDARAWLNRLGNPYAAIGVDPQGRRSIEWGVYGVPETFVIDRTGRIRYRHVGAVTDNIWQDTLRPVVEELKR